MPNEFTADKDVLGPTTEQNEQHSAFLRKKVQAIRIRKNRKISDLLAAMRATGFQGRKLGEAFDTLVEMVHDPEVTVLMGYAASLSVAGQWRLIEWLLQNNFVDILVTTGANISEDIVEAMGHSYFQCSHLADDEKLFQEGINRYYDVAGNESDYLGMTELLATFIASLDTSRLYSSREFLYQCGLWLSANRIRSLVAIAAEQNIPIFCPAIADSPFGDAALIATSRGVVLGIDAVKDYVEFMSLAKNVQETGVFYLGGGVPKDFIQLFAVSSDFLYANRIIPGRQKHRGRATTDETYYPHKYAIQITTDAPQWGGLSGCTFDEAVSWGKERRDGQYVQCFCDATVALPLLVHALAEVVLKKRKGRELGRYLSGRQATGGAGPGSAFDIAR
ncbi:MAG TPA: deoxyhypusine synthase family protein [Thermodesulfobacteriota bacterium]|nr:deoxyhypusine synthase family protein [Deltaproteobacteria bacterium]HNR13130.1 deoxyhypusine synthase family protein [Thermodesulfobacteriota bacterium]HNU72654.1 deoxyhypusine synthase family protein [Thermodesulfobacteriota bacterium]